jgi:hypothetical protein
MHHNLNHALNVGSKSTRSLRVDGNIPYLIHDVVKHIKPLMLHERIKQVLLIGWNGVGVLFIIRCKVRKCGRIPSTFGARKPLFMMYIGVISLGAITLPVFA